MATTCERYEHDIELHSDNVRILERKRIDLEQELAAAKQAYDTKETEFARKRDAETASFTQAERSYQQATEAYNAAKAAFQQATRDYDIATREMRQTTDTIDRSVRRIEADRKQTIITFERKDKQLKEELTMNQSKLRNAERDLRVCEDREKQQAQAKNKDQEKTKDTTRPVTSFRY